MKIRVPLLSLLLAASGLPLAGHDTWLQAQSNELRPGEIAQLQFTSGNGFNGGEQGPRPQRIQRATLRLAGYTESLGLEPLTARFLNFSRRVMQPGIAAFAVELKPRELTLEPTLVEEYLAEIHAGPDLRAAWAAVPAPRLWRERYVKCATTFIRVGEPPERDRSWDKPAGLSLEIVPQQDATSLHAGDILKVRVLRKGHPLPGLPLGFVADGETSHHVAITDAEGYASAPLDRPGRWLVHGTDLRRSSEANLEWESVFSTLVVNVGTTKK